MMSIIYIISILSLLISFLLFEKRRQEISIVSNVIYAICLFFCEQVVMVCILSFFRLGGSLLFYSIFQYIVSGILFLFSYRRKRIQKYYFDRLELLSVVVIILVCFLISWIRFDGFRSISYASDDSSVHYKTALVFSQVLEKLNGSNHVDLMHGDFIRMMPMSYINGGFFIRLFNFSSSFRLFLIYDSVCFIMYTLLFFETIMQRKRYFFSIVMSFLYGLSYPLNNLIFGFGYLGLGVMVINLLYYTIVHIDGYLKDKWLFKILILFILCFSLYYSYYLFMPFVYLSMGIYYIMLWKRGKLSFKLMIIYGIVTLIIPFSLGTLRFILPTFFSNSSNVFQTIRLDGDIYHNILPIYFFLLFSFYLVYKKNKIDYFILNIYILSIFILLFLILHILGLSGYYYFYKLFYIYFLFVFIYFGLKIFRYRKYVYYFGVLMMIGCLIVGFYPNSCLSSVLMRTTIYQYNTRKFARDRVKFTKDELNLVDMARELRSECEYNHEFLLVGRYSKNLWFYEITGSIPVLNHIPKNRGQLYTPNISFFTWEKNSNYPCVVVFYEDRNISYDFSDYDIVYSNRDGAIIRRKNND